MVLKRNDEIIAEQTTFSGLRVSLIAQGHHRDVISWITVVEMTQPGTCTVYQYRRPNGDLWELRRN